MRMLMQVMSAEEDYVMSWRRGVKRLGGERDIYRISSSY